MLAGETPTANAFENSTTSNEPGLFMSPGKENITPEREESEDVPRRRRLVRHTKRALVEEEDDDADVASPIGGVIHPVKKGSKRVRADEEKDYVDRPEKKTVSSDTCLVEIYTNLVCRRQLLKPLKRRRRHKLLL